MEYDLKELQKDLKRLDKKLEDLTEWMEKKGKKIDYLAKEELTEKIITLCIWLSAWNSMRGTLKRRQR